MRRFLSAGLVAMALTIAAGTPIPVRAATTTQTFDLATRQTDDLSAGEYDGRLRLTVSSDGIVGGTFMDTEGNLSPVFGGLTGTKLWIDIGSASPTPARLFNGTFADGKLTATAPHGLHVWTLEGSSRTHY